MPNYYANEAAFVLPEKGFVDRTLHRLDSPLSGADSLGIEIRRLPLEPGKSLRQLVDGEVAAATAKANGYTILKQAEVALSGAPAIVIRARLRARDQVYYRLEAHVAFAETWITFVVSGPFAERAACDETFNRIVESLEWRND